jgi:hypothetical protein
MTLIITFMNAEDILKSKSFFLSLDSTNYRSKKKDRITCKYSSLCLMKRFQHETHLMIILTYSIKTILVSQNYLRTELLPEYH